jgi:hypothetical protein
MKTVLMAMLALRALAQPAWTDILNSAGTPSMLNGTYWRIGQTPQPAQVTTTTLAAISNSLALSVPTLTGTGNQGGTNNCGVVGSPATYIESNNGTGIKGVGFYGSFNSPVGGAPLTYQPNQNLFESVFFHEDPCYGGTQGTISREYGFFLAASNSSIWVYWGTKENQVGQVQAQLQLSGVQPNTTYYYSMYPAISGGSCGFNVYVLDAGFNAVYPLTFLPVNSNNYGGTITTADPGFCADVTSAPSGYVSANIVAAPQVSGTLPMGLGLSLSRVYVGK